jgi:hypothetical protein
MAYLHNCWLETLVPWHVSFSIEVLECSNEMEIGFRMSDLRDMVKRKL